ncbi:hypothetical protein [Nocardia blacklockiae]|uniref:hypothetical protein n=1 Tax=Nocardia blacklockiae TaxID=480036 RepID=UPI0018948097|nr:hypothetical protein [Nocardia blacklockiae]MBF6172248.1 hypothetical protein [Nocardia blacklockiae]
MSEPNAGIANSDRFTPYFRITGLSHPSSLPAGPPGVRQAATDDTVLRPTAWQRSNQYESPKINGQYQPVKRSDLRERAAENAANADRR